MRAGSFVQRRFDAVSALGRWPSAMLGVALLALALLALGPLAGVATAAPGNDAPTGATPIPMSWTNAEQSVETVPAATWSTATAVDDTPPTCTGPGSDYSQWWSVTVKEPGTLQVRVASANPASFLPVVTVYGASSNEVACATTDPQVKASPPSVTATAYVFPINDATPQTYLIRVAQAIPQPATNRSSYDLFVTGRDLTAPHVVVTMPKNIPEVGTTARYDASQTTDLGAGRDDTSATWAFKDRFGSPEPAVGMTATHTWKTPGLHKVTFSIRDFAGNATTYTFFVFVHDWTPPRIRAFGVKSVPFPGGRYVTLMTTHDEPVTLHLTITQGKRLLYRGNMRLLKGTKTTRRVHLRAKVQRTPWISIAGSAKDSAGNVTVLPGCHLDPVTGGGHCFLP